MEKFKTILIGVFLLLIIFLLHRSGKFKSEYERESLNYSALIDEKNHLTDGYAATQRLSEREFDEQYGAVIDSLDKLTADKLKLSRVLALTQFRLSHVRRDVKTMWLDSITPGDTIPIGKKLILKDSCLSVSVYEPTNPDSSLFAYISASVVINADIVYYEGKRTKQVKMFGMNLFRYGPRKPSAQIFSNCGEIKARSIENGNHLRK